MSDTVLVVGLGSNINPLFHLKKALATLKSIPQVEVLNVARIYESDPELPEQNAFDHWKQPYLNSAVLLRVENFQPADFLKILKNLEVIIGRKRVIETQRWAPREIDLDILFAEGVKFETETLQIPHRRLLTRPFALLPLFDVYSEEGFFSHLSEMQLISEVPHWIRQRWSSIIPFNTHPSKKFFWTEFMGILNLTQDSFSDGRTNNSEEKFKTNARRLLHSGAQVLDLGAESTRPVTDLRIHDQAQELSLLTSALTWLQDLRSEGSSFKISIDTRHPDVAAGIINNFQIDYLNDVTGFRDSKMLELSLAFKGQMVVMHSLSVPVIKNEIIDEKVSPIDTLNHWWKVKLEELLRAGIAKERIIFDPGVGFGKSTAQSHFILKNLELIDTKGCAVLVGHSRKSFLQSLTSDEAKDRDPETALVTKSMNKAYYHYLRVHNVSANQSALIQ